MKIQIKDEYVHGEFLVFCELQKNCTECPFHKMDYCHAYPDEHLEETRSIMIDWYETHPKDKERYLREKAAWKEKQEEEENEEDEEEEE